jgi:hypothetical protein
MYSTFIAIFFKIYTMELVDNGWPEDVTGSNGVPKQVFSPGVALPEADVRVRIRRRQLKPERVTW